MGSSFDSEDVDLNRSFGDYSRDTYLASAASRVVVFDGNLPCDDHDEFQEHFDARDVTYKKTGPGIREWLGNAPCLLRSIIVLSTGTCLVSLLFVFSGLVLSTFVINKTYTGVVTPALTSIESGAPSTLNRSIFPTDGNPKEFLTAHPSNVPSGYQSLIPTEHPSFHPTDIVTEYSTLGPTAEPSLYLTENPTDYNSLIPTEKVTVRSTDFPTERPTPIPTTEHTSAKPSDIRTSHPSIDPSPVPSTSVSVSPTQMVSLQPSLVRSGEPTENPSFQATRFPSLSPTTPAPSAPKETSFYAIGDRYAGKAQQLTKHLHMLDEKEGEFIVHLGDYIVGSDVGGCELSKFDEYRLRLDNSTVPVFVVLGDDEWNDCSDTAVGRDAALYNFRATFGYYDQMWNHPMYDVKRKLDKPEYFSFIQRNVLFVSVHIVGGARFDETTVTSKKWEDHLLESRYWVQDQMSSKEGLYSNMVIFGNDNHRRDESFFNDIKDLTGDLGIVSLYVYTTNKGRVSRMEQQSEYFWMMEVESNKIPFNVITVDTGKATNPFSFKDSTI